MDAPHILGDLRRAKAEVRKSQGCRGWGGSNMSEPREVCPRPGPATGLQPASHPQQGSWETLEPWLPHAKGKEW